METLTTTKLLPSTLRFLRLAAALTGERQYQVVDRLVRAELARLRELETPCDT